MRRKNQTRLWDAEECPGREVCSELDELIRASGENPTGFDLACVKQALCEAEVFIQWIKELLDCVTDRKAPSKRLSELIIQSSQDLRLTLLALELGARKRKRKR